MVGSLIIGISTGAVAAVTAMFSGYGLLAAVGIYALCGALAMIAVVLLALRNAMRDTEDAATTAFGLEHQSQ